MPENVTLSITDDEAMVLFEWLSDLDDDSLEAPERAAVWAMVAALERVLVAPFKSDYSELLSAARARLAPNG